MPPLEKRRKEKGAKTADSHKISKGGKNKNDIRDKYLPQVSFSIMEEPKIFTKELKQKAKREKGGGGKTSLTITRPPP